MDITTVLAIFLGIGGVIIAIYMQVYARLAKTRIESERLSMQTELMAEKTAVETVTKLEAIADRVRRLETGISLELIAEEQVQNIDNRLQDIEKTLERFKNRGLELTSLEYQFLIFEIDRLVRDLKEDLIERQRTYESILDRRLGTFRTIFVVSLTIVGIIIACFGLVIYLIGS